MGNSEERWRNENKIKEILKNENELLKDRVEKGMKDRDCEYLKPNEFESQKA